MRERDKWWAFFRGDAGWQDVPSQYHGKKNAVKGGWEEGAVGFEYEQPGQRAKMRGWVVYEEKLSWDSPDGCEVVELSYGCGEDDGGEKITAEKEGEDGDRGEESGGGLSPSEGNGKGKDLIMKMAILTPHYNHPVAVEPAQHMPKPREPTPELLDRLNQVSAALCFSVFLQQRSQRTTLHLLKYFTQWIQCHFDHSFLSPPPPPPGTRAPAGQVYDLTPTHARWIFALLARLDEHLTGDEISVLRHLARQLLRVVKAEKLAAEASEVRSGAVLRAAAGVDECVVRQQASMGATGCWMVVAAVSDVWRQKDLWADAEDALR